MKKVLWALVTGVFVLSSCGRVERQVTRDSAERFMKLLDQELGQLGAAQMPSLPSLWGQGPQNVYTSQFIYYVPADRLKADQLCDTANGVLKKWGEIGIYAHSVRGGGGSDFQMHYGTQRTHAFIDALAYAREDKIVVVLLMKVIE
jgi:hypothetical protein